MKQFLLKNWRNGKTMKNKGFIQTPILIGIIIAIIIISAVIGSISQKPEKPVTEEPTPQPIIEKEKLTAEVIPKIGEKPAGVGTEEEKLPIGEGKLPTEESPPVSPTEEKQPPKETSEKKFSCKGIICPTCHYCLEGKCVAQPNGFNDCGSGCQRCINGSCQDYNPACSNCQYCSLGTCINYCTGTDINCGCTNCADCNNLDGWVNTGSSYPCCDGNKSCTCQQQEYRDYRCLGGSCSYSATETRISKSGCVECGFSKSCLNGICQSNCAGTDVSCGSTSCVNCNNLDGCSGNSYLDYYCSGISCVYTSDNCSDCSCSCGGYNVKESIANGNCSDGKDNDCDGVIDSADSECAQTSATALITYVIDGDTAKISTGESIRLIGINAPERGQPYYEEATNRLKTLIEGKSVRLEKDIDDQDQWGRLLRFILYDDENINVKMIREGYATVYIIPPNTKYKAELENAWQECLNDKINLCKPGEDICDNTCIGIDYFHWNAEGNDCYNLNDEYVTFRNSCSYSCDLTDWTVKDESSRSSYSFPTFTLKSGATVILYTGCGTNTETELYWCSSGYSCNAIWNNSCSGDTLYLRNRRGELILDYHYTGFCE